MPTVFDNLSEETRDQLAGLALKLSGSQKTRKSFLGLVKEVSPDTPVPEIDTDNAVQAALKTEREERVKFEAEQRDRWFKEELGKTKAGVVQKYGLSDDDMAKMEKMMTDKALPADYNWAAQLYKQQSEPAGATNYGADHGNVDVKGYIGTMEGLMEDPDNWSRNQAHSMIDDIRRKGAAKAW